MRNLFIIIALGVVGWFVWGHTRSIKNAGQPVSVIVAFGDSLTAGHGARARHNTYPAVLARLSGKRVINEGLSGETAVHAPSRLPRILEHRPQMVLIEFGANDFMQGLSREKAVEAVSSIVDAVQAAGAIAVIVDTGGPGMGSYSSDYRRLAKQKQAVFVPGILKDIFHKKEYMSDMIHPNPEGYSLVAQHVYTYIAPYLEK